MLLRELMSKRLDMKQLNKRNMGKQDKIDKAIVEAHRNKKEAEAIEEAKKKPSIIRTSSTSYVWRA